MFTSQIILFGTLLLQIFSLQKVSFFGIPIYFLEFCIGLAIIFSAGLFLRKKQIFFSKKIQVDKYILIGTALFLFGAISSTLFNQYSTTALGQLKSWFLFPITYFLWAVFLISRTKADFLYRAWYLGSLSIVFVALCGYINGIVTYDHRLAFPYTSPNFLAYLCFPSILIGIYFLSFLQGNKKRLLQGMIVISIIASSFVLYQTHSYNAWISTIFSLLVGIFIYNKKKSNHYLEGFSWKIILGILFIVGFILFFEAQNEKWQNLLSNNGRSALDSRIAIWKVGVVAIKDNPFIGIGVGNFQETYLSYQNQFPLYLEWAVPQPHNIFLGIWLQTGLIGLIGFLLLIMRIFFILYRKLKEAISEKEKKEGILLFSLWIFFVSYGLLDTPYFRNDLAFLFWTTVLLNILYVKSSEKREL